MSSAPASFIEISADLTGFSPTLLRGTGMVEVYWLKIRSIIPEKLLSRLVGDGTGADEQHPATPERLLADADLGPVARGLIMLWYCGSWTQLPPDWRARNGAQDADVTGVVSSAAYQSGLQWTAVGAHPAGARQQGFGSWALPPVEPVPLRLTPVGLAE